MPDLYALWENSLRCFLIQKNGSTAAERGQGEAGECRKKKFVISPGKRIFSRVEQECETEVQGWNGTVPKGRAKTGGASVGAGQKSGACEAGAREYGAREKGRGAGRRRRAEPRGCVREAGEGKVRAKRRDCSGERGAAGKSTAEGELEPGGEERKNAAGRTTARRKDADGTEERTAVRGSCGIVEGWRGGDMQARRAAASGRQLSPAETLR